jgi:predicted Zn finger-like uncharacterized protein
MFTVCPKCALTLVVTAADLRVAQGYVRCGRCSNVFNALARLSEDRGAAAAAAAAQSAQASTGVHPQLQEGAEPPAPSQPSAPTSRPPQATGSFVYTKPPDAPAPAKAPSPAPAGRAAPQPGSTAPRAPQGTQGGAQGPHGPAASANASTSTSWSSASAPDAPGGSAPDAPGGSAPDAPGGSAPGAPGGSAPGARGGASAPNTAAGGAFKPNATSPRPGQPPLRPQQAGGTSSGAPLSGVSASRPAAPPPSAPLSTPSPLDNDDDIPEDALEFNPDAADVNQVFVEPPPNPEWTAATGTFKAIVLKSEEAAGAPKAPTPGGATHAPDPGAGATGSGQAFSFNTTPDEDEIELDADFLSATAEMRRLKTGLSDADTSARRPTPPVAPIPPAATSHGQAASHSPAASQAQPTSPSLATSHAQATPNSPATSNIQATSNSPAAPQAQIAPSARMAPRGPIAEPPTPSRTAGAEAVSRAPPRQQQTPESLDTEVFPEPEVVTRAPPRSAVKAFGVGAIEPPPERLATLARSRVAPGSVELEQAPPPKPSLLNSDALWSAGAGALVILLIAQVVNHYRNDLAASAQFNKPITALYASLGVHLTPRWDLHAYDVRQLGASVEAGSAGQIMVRASVKNGAQQAQPMPLLRVTLQDRFGNRIAARDVPPGSYLPRATAGTTLLPAGQRIDAEMAFVDPGANAVGFEIDACLPAPAGGIACANDPVSR